MEHYITDNLGKKLIVTDVEAGIAQAKLYTSFDKGENKELNDYWVDILKKLKRLKKQINLEVKVDKPIDPIGDTIPNWVREIREEYVVRNGIEPNYKGFSKDRKKTPIYGIHSCARSERNLANLNNLKVGESYNTSTRIITRIW